MGGEKKERPCCEQQHEDLVDKETAPVRQKVQKYCNEISHTWFGFKTPDAGRLSSTINDPLLLYGAKLQRGWALQCTAHPKLSFRLSSAMHAYALVWSLSWTWAWLTAGAPAEHGESLEHHFVEEERHRLVL